MRGLWGWGLAAMLAASGAGADVKAGTEAWAGGDYRAAVEEWRGPAIAGDPDAQFNLGQAYKLGRGVPLDPALAESWFHKAAMQHHPQAEDNYGLALYQSGRRGEAMPWLERSIARGEPRAQLVLGTMLFNGDTVPRDVPRAFALMTRASQAGLKAASQTLAQMDDYISPAEREKGTALAARYAAEQQAVDGAPPMRVTVAGAGARQLAALPPTVMYKPDARATPAATRTPRSPPPKVPAAAKPSTGGSYRVQLGAFRDEANARALWSRVGGRIGGTPGFAKAGGLTRLVGGAFASAADAQRACRAAGVQCVVTR